MQDLMTSAQMAEKISVIITGSEMARCSEKIITSDEMAARVSILLPIGANVHES